MKDVLPTLTELSVFFQKESVGLASVPAMVSSTITTLQALRDDLNGDLANLPSLKELNQGVLADGLYHEKELQQAGDNARQSFIAAGDTFLANSKP